MLSYFDEAIYGLLIFAVNDEGSLKKLPRHGERKVG